MPDDTGKAFSPEALPARKQQGPGSFQGRISDEFHPVAGQAGQKPDGRGVFHIKTGPEGPGHENLVQVLDVQGGGFQEHSDPGFDRGRGELEFPDVRSRQEQVRRRRQAFLQPENPSVGG